MRAAPNPRTLTGWSGASPHVLRFPVRAFLRFPVCPPGPSPSSAFLWFPSVRRSPVCFPSAVARFRFPFGVPPGPFPLSNLHGSAAAGRVRRRWSRAAGTKVTSSAATPSLGSRDPPAHQMGSGWARWDAATESPFTSGRAQDTGAFEPSRSADTCAAAWQLEYGLGGQDQQVEDPHLGGPVTAPGEDRKSTRLNSSHVSISYAVFC